MTRLKNWVPPQLHRLLRRTMSSYGWSGNYECWEAAARRCSGYSSSAILAQVRHSTCKVRDGAALFERDSVLFNEPQYSWPLLAGLLHSAASNGGVLRVLDFGGALGSTYFQNRTFTASLSHVRWSIVEQEEFVRIGRKEFQNDRLRFYYSVDECLAEEEIDVLLLSSVLQYLPAPLAFLENLLDRGIRKVIIDRTGFSDSGNHRIAIQKVHPSIYNASYPCHFFSRREFERVVVKNYDVIGRFDALDKTAYPASFCGLLLQQKAAPLKAASCTALF